MPAKRKMIPGTLTFFAGSSGTPEPSASEAIFKVGLCLPSGPCVSDDDVRYIVDSIKSAIS